MLQKIKTALVVALKNVVSNKYKVIAGIVVIIITIPIYNILKNFIIKTGTPVTIPIDKNKTVDYSNDILRLEEMRCVYKQSSIEVKNSCKK